MEYLSETHMRPDLYIEFVPDWFTFDVNLLLLYTWNLHCDRRTYGGQFYKDYCTTASPLNHLYLISSSSVQFTVISLALLRYFAWTVFLVFWSFVSSLIPMVFFPCLLSFGFRSLISYANPGIFFVEYFFLRLKPVS